MKRSGLIAFSMILALSLLAFDAPLWAQAGQGGGNQGGGQGGGGQGGGGQGGGNQGGGNQGGGNQGGGNQGGNQGGPTQPGQNDPFGGPQQRPTQRMPQPIYLSGNVILDNGQPMTEPVTIMRVCNGSPVPETMTDTKGRFSFQVGGDPSLAMTDASVGGLGGGGFGGAGFGGGGFSGPQYGGASGGDPSMGVDLTGCEIRADLPGYRSDSIQLGRRRSLDRPEIGTIVLHSLSGVKGSIVSVTTLEAPKKARQSYDKALREMSKKQGDPQKAVKELEKAVSLYPKFAAAWAILGTARMRLADEPGAAEAFEKAIEADPDYLRPYPELVQLQIQQKNWPRTLELTDAMIKLNPAQLQVRYFGAVARFNMGDLEAAEEVALDIQEREDGEEFPQTHQMIGMILSKRGEFQRAAEQFRRYLELDPDAAAGQQIRKQLNEWEALGVIEPVKAADADASAEAR